VPPLSIEVLFAVVWGSFGLLHLAWLDAFARQRGGDFAPDARWRAAAFAVGLLGGGVVVAITGVGAEMLFYTLLVLGCRADLRLAIPSAVALMAFTSLVGSATKALSGGFEPGVFPNWLAAAPVVVLGAPLGALVVARIGRKPTLAIVSVLCVLQLVFTLVRRQQALGAGGTLLALLVLGAFLLGFAALGRAGGLRERLRPAETSPDRHTERG
jgi:uncharacterized membrane protein YfcA